MATTQAKPPKTPTCEKLALHKEEIEAAREFCEWAAQQGLEFATRHDHTKACYQRHVHTDSCNIFRATPCKQTMDRVCGFHEDELQPHHERIETMIMRWLKIDERKLESERAAILDHHRKVTGQG